MRYLFCLVAFILSSCIEYRWNRDGVERYISTYPVSTEKRKLDPKAGPRAKLWLSPGGDARPYVGGDFRDNQYITGSVGLIVYPSKDLSLEIGFRTLIHQLDYLKPYEDNIRVDQWESMPNMFFIGGVLIF